MLRMLTPRRIRLAYHSRQTADLATTGACQKPPMETHAQRGIRANTRPVQSSACHGPRAATRAAKCTACLPGADERRRFLSIGRCQQLSFAARRCTCWTRSRRRRWSVVEEAAAAHTTGGGRACGSSPRHDTPARLALICWIDATPLPTTRASGHATGHGARGGTRGARGATRGHAGTQSEPGQHTEETRDIVRYRYLYIHTVHCPSALVKNCPLRSHQPAALVTSTLLLFTPLCCDARPRHRVCDLDCWH